MIIKMDAKALEWRSYLELSRDPVGIQEILEGQDVHSNNQAFFNLPSRLIAKVFLFRWIYRGSAWAYANDNDFIPVSKDPGYWQDVIDRANTKYKVLYEYQANIMRRVENREVITIPSGREFLFDLVFNKKMGVYQWDHKKTVNYINQGFGADIMQMARVMLRSRLRKYDPKKVLPVNTVHDDIGLDVANDPELLYNICIEMENLMPDVPSRFKSYFNYDFVVPLDGEVSFGPNFKDLIEFDRTKGKEQFYAN